MLFSKPRCPLCAFRLSRRNLTDYDPADTPEPEPVPVPVPVPEVVQENNHTAVDEEQGNEVEGNGLSAEENHPNEENNSNEEQQNDQEPVNAVDEAQQNQIEENELNVEVNDREGFRARSSRAFDGLDLDLNWMYLFPRERRNVHRFTYVDKICITCDKNFTTIGDE